MSNLNVSEQSSKLRLPYCYVEFTNDELEYFDGSWLGETWS